MKNLVCSCLAVGLLLVPVLGDPITLTDGGPSMTLTYETSDSTVHGTAEFSLLGNVLTIVMTNTSTSAAGTGVLTGLGWDTTPDTTVIGEAFVGDGSGWDYSTNGGGLGGFEHRDSVTGIGDGLDPGQMVTVMLTLEASSDPADPISPLTIEMGSQMHFQGMPGTGESEKPEGFRVPEPTSMILLGLGLVGIGVLRRKV